MRSEKKQPPLPAFRAEPARTLSDAEQSLLTWIRTTPSLSHRSRLVAEHVVRRNVSTFHGMFSHEVAALKRQAFDLRVKLIAL